MALDSALDFFVMRGVVATNDDGGMIFVMVPFCWGTSTAALAERVRTREAAAADGEVIADFARPPTDRNTGVSGPIADIDCDDIVLISNECV